MDRKKRDRFAGIFSLVTMTVALTVIWTPGRCLAIGDITVSPTRVVFEGNVRKARVALINRGTSPQTYRIAWTRKRLTEQGDYETIDTPRPGEAFSDSMVRFSPRQVVLPPGKPQTVRLLLRKPAGLADGEYRSYLTFTALPSADDDGIERQLDHKEEIAIHLRPVMSISIPVIVRHGRTEADVALSTLSLQPTDDGGTALEMVFEHSGNRSLHGDVIVEFHPRSGGGAITVGRANGVSVFPPAERRRFRLPLEVPAGTELRHGELRVRYREQSADDDSSPLAEAVLRLP